MHYLAILFRWLHILAAIAAVGGTIFTRFALIPAIGTLPESARAQFLEALRVRWAKVVMAAIGLLLVSGLYNIMVIERDYRFDQSGLYHALFGIKFLLALGIFFLASVLSGRSDLARRLQADAKKWVTLNLIMAVILVCISGVLKTMDRTPKASSPHAPASDTSPNV